MSSVQTGLMSAAETGQMSSAARTDMCLVSLHNVEVSEVSIGNVTMFKSQIGGLALNQRKWSEVGPEWSPGPENRSPGMPRPIFLASGTGPPAPNRQNIAQTPDQPPPAAATGKPINSC